MTNRKIVSPSDMAFSYMGRIDFSKPDSPLFIYAGSLVSTKFTGTSVGMMIFPH
ncbi:MAG: lipase, partial [[Eubacterium] siraeum]